MRIQTTVTDLNQFQWDLVQKTVLTGYNLHPGTVRTCVVFQHAGEERHAEMPLGMYYALMKRLPLMTGTDRLTTAMAALTPDDPDLDRAKYGFSQSDPSDLL